MNITRKYRLMKKLATSKWRALLSAGELSPSAIKRLRGAGLLGEEQTATYIKGLQRGNRALMKRHGIKPTKSVTKPGFRATLRPKSQEHTITGGGYFKGKKRTKGESAQTRAGIAALATRHEINEILAGVKKLQSGKNIKDDKFYRTFRHLDPSVLQRESRHLRFLSPDAQKRMLRRREKGGEVNLLEQVGGYPNLYATSAKKRKTIRKEILESMEDYSSPRKQETISKISPPAKTELLPSNIKTPTSSKPKSPSVEQGRSGLGRALGRTTAGGLSLAAIAMGLRAAGRSKTLSSNKWAGGLVPAALAGAALPIGVQTLGA